eukprot:6476966-Amphidinium_carterae.1
MEESCAWKDVVSAANEHKIADEGNKSVRDLLYATQEYTKDRQCVEVFATLVHTHTRTKKGDQTSQ